MSGDVWLAAVCAVRMPSLINRPPFSKRLWPLRSPREHTAQRQRGHGRPTQSGGPRGPSLGRKPRGEWGGPNGEAGAGRALAGVGGWGAGKEGSQRAGYTASHSSCRASGQRGPAACCQSMGILRSRRELIAEAPLLMPAQDR